MFNIAQYAGVVAGQLVEGVALEAGVDSVASQAVGDVAWYASVFEHCKVSHALRADVILLTKGAVSDRTGHRLASVVLQLVVGLAFLTHLER